MLRTAEVGCASRCLQWFAYDWDEVGQLHRARRWDFTTTLPKLPAGSTPAQPPVWDLDYDYSSGARVRKTTKGASTAAAEHTLDVFANLRLHRVPFDEAAKSKSYSYARVHMQLFLGGGILRVFYDATDALPTAPVQGKLHAFVQIGDHLGLLATTVGLIAKPTDEDQGQRKSDPRGMLVAGLATAGVGISLGTKRPHDLEPARASAGTTTQFRLP